MRTPFRSRITVLAFIIAALFLSPAAVHSSQPSDDAPVKRVIGYFTQWGIYDRGYRIQQLEKSGAAAVLTHLIYAYANVSPESKCYTENKEGAGDASADYGMAFTAAQSVDGKADAEDQALRGNFNQIKKLKALHPDLKVLIVIGGWSWSSRFSTAALPENREAFVKSCVDMYIHGDLPVIDGAGGPGAAAGVFDGIEIDWEFGATVGATNDAAQSPTSRDPNHAVEYREEDPSNYVALMQEFRKQLDDAGSANGTHYLLTIASPADKDAYHQMELATMQESLDWMDIESYGLHGAWEPNGPTTFHANLYTSDDDPSEVKASVDDTIQSYLDAGVPADKVVLGVPFFGHGWTGVPNKNHGLYQQGDSIKPAPAAVEEGTLDYRDLVKLKFPSFRDDKTQGQWIFNGKTFWAFDDVAAIQAKMNYVKENGLGGAMVWSLDGDDDKATLLKAVAEGLK